MDDQKVVKRVDIVSEEEKKLKSSLDSLCSLLPSSNINQLVSLSNQFDKLVVPFLEKPHLLDRIVRDSVESLIKTVTDFVLADSDQDKTKINAIFTVLYSIIRVRGRKTAVAYFPNDVFLLTPFIHFLKQYDETDLSLWKSQFVLLFWVSLLLLSPFDLSFIQEENEDLAADLYNLSVLYMSRADPVGEVAAEMLSLFLSRKDISSTYLQPTLQLLVSQLDVTSSSLYCNLLCLASFLKHVHDNEMRSVISMLESVFVSRCEELVDSPSIHFKTRILLMKITSQLCIHRLQLLYNDYGIVINTRLDVQKAQDFVEIPEDISELLSNCISLLLSQLQENSILLREKVSSYISKVSVFLPTDFCQTVVSEVLSLMQENSSVESLHGCCYTLAALLSNRLIPSSQIEEIISLTQEYAVYQIAKNSASTTAIIRDSACYILWSLARNYPPSSFLEFVPSVFRSLIILCIADKEINTRRAASAVIQEIVGRAGAECIPAGISLINILNYTSLAQMQNISNVVIPELAQLTEYEELICSYMKWVVEKQENLQLTEYASKAMLHVAQHLPSLVQLLVIDPLVQAEWSQLNYRLLASTVLMLSSCLKGLHLKNVPLSAEHISRIIGQFKQVIKKSFSPKQTLQLRSYYLSLLQSLTYFTDDFYELFSLLFPLPLPAITWQARQLIFTPEEQCLLVCSQWFYEHSHPEGLQHCSELIQHALSSPSEYSIHVIGAIYYKITANRVSSLIALFRSKQDAAVFEALAVIIARLLFIQPVEGEWEKSFLDWLSACCSCYLRDIRGDVGSWTRSAAISHLQYLIDKLVFALPTSSVVSQRIHGLRDYYVTPHGVARALEGTAMEYLPLTEGSTLYSGVTIGAELDVSSKSSCIAESVVEPVCRVLLKQLAEQHSVIRTNAHSILSFLLRLQEYHSPFMVHLQSYTLNQSITEQLVYYLDFEDLSEIVLSGLIFLIGGNTPVITEEATTLFIQYLSGHKGNTIVLPLLRIMKSEYEKATNGFYPALKTFTVCLETVDIMESLGEDDLVELRDLIGKASKRYKNKVAVLKSLLELLQVIGSSAVSSRELVSLFLPFLSSSFSHIREESSQVLYLTLSMKEILDDFDNELLQVIGEGDFTESCFSSSVDQLRSLLQLFVCLENMCEIKILVSLLVQSISFCPRSCRSILE